MKRIIKFLKNWTRPTGMACDTLMPFTEGDVALIPPSMHHHWDYNPASADEKGCIRYLMVAFSHSFVRHCMDTFPELRNRLANVTFAAEALKSPFRAGIYERKRRFAGKIQKGTVVGK